ncbi:MAG: hypothetical protein A2Y62_03505 [Candidatus Fischerbacteria bacterium RBG_13_37_8]|uniref:Zinc-finger domain-containing protein n=1 Tax=Candidatus Fischerbacteria bacterium RBG_13_37_8 TaxID=1817863 RepID=A0A1F5VKE9_9BACT|nr:MAG: hypothetical protein A2Y62_03505 [Candidatus Fischerbacteria bacterium RBG_13_37_8]
MKQKEVKAILLKLSASGAYDEILAEMRNERHPSSEQINSFLCKELSEADADQVNRHLAFCDICAKKLIYHQQNEETAQRKTDLLSRIIALLRTRIFFQLI